ncbi:MAG: DUF4105 domain-containing protein [Bdellovibrionales bacterium]
MKNILLFLLLFIEPAFGKRALFLEAENLSVSKEKLVELSTDPVWLKLSRYREQVLGGYKSSITSKDFFLSPKGRVSPLRELEETLKLLKKELQPKENLNRHPVCRFPARLQWVREHIKNFKTPQIECVNYKKWIDEESVDSVSMIFATGYLSNPASYYGHILMRFNGSAEGSGLLDVSLNYGAIIKPNENAVLYILKGLFGGYQAEFTYNEVYSHNHNYGDNDLRDLWNYELNLNREQTLILLRNAWEMLDAKFTYFFTKQNCAYKMLEHLELVLNEPVVQRRGLWMMPISVFHTLGSLNKDRGIIKKVSKIPSLQSKMQRSYLKLTKQEQGAFRETIKTREINNDSYRSLSNKKKDNILKGLLKYYNYAESKSKNKKSFNEEKRNILVEQFNLSERKGAQYMKEDVVSRIDKPIHTSQKPSLLGLSHLKRENVEGINLRFRPAYYDLLSPVVGRSPFTGLAMFDFNFSVVDDIFFLNSLTLVEIENLNLSRTFLPYDGGLSWNVKFGLEQQTNQCIDCPVYYFTGGLGKALDLKAGALFAYLQGRAEMTPYADVDVEGALRMGVVSRSFKGARIKAEVKLIESTSEVFKDQNYSINSELRYSLTKNMELSFQYSKKIEREVLMGLYVFW